MAVGVQWLEAGEDVNGIGGAGESLSSELSSAQFMSSVGLGTTTAQSTPATQVVEWVDSEADGSPEWKGKGIEEKDKVEESCVRGDAMPATPPPSSSKRKRNAHEDDKVVQRELDGLLTKRARKPTQRFNNEPPIDGDGGAGKKAQKRRKGKADAEPHLHLNRKRKRKWSLNSKAPMTAPQLAHLTRRRGRRSR